MEEPLLRRAKAPVEAEWPRSRVKAWIYAAVATLAAAFLLRHAVIEPHWIGIACGEETVPWWCHLRQGIVWMHLLHLWGILGLVGGLAAIVFGWMWAIRLGFVMGLMGLVLYNADFAAVGLMLTLLRLPRA